MPNLTFRIKRNSKLGEYLIVYFIRVYIGRFANKRLLSSTQTIIPLFCELNAMVKSVYRSHKFRISVIVRRSHVHAQASDDETRERERESQGRANTAAARRLGGCVTNKFSSADKYYPSVQLIYLALI